MAVEYGNWAELQRIIPVTSTPQEVPLDYQFQPYECAYFPSGTYTQSGIYEGHVPTEVDFLEALRKQLAQNAVTLLYCRCTITKTVFGNQWGRIYYKVDATIEDCVVQFGTTQTLMGLFLMIAIVAVCVASVTVAFFAFGGMNILYAILGIPPEDVSKYNDAQSKLWAGISQVIWSGVALLSVGVVGFGLFMIYTGKRSVKVGEKK